MAGGEVKWYKRCGKVWLFHKKLNIELPCELTNPVLEIHSRTENTHSHKNLYMNVHSSTFQNSQK